MHTPQMPDYRRNRIPGRTFFFTVNLLDRRSNLMVANIDAARCASPSARPRTFSHRRLGRPPQPQALSVDIAARRCRFSGSVASDQDRIGEIAADRRAAIIGHNQPWRTRQFGSGRTGNTRSAMIATSRLTWTRRISTQSYTVSWRTRRIGRIRRFIGASAAGYILPVEGQQR
jgi:hypothetical protein